MSDATEKASGFAQSLGDAARRSPMSAALIGMGVLWLFSSGKSAGRAGDLLRSTGLDRVPEVAKNTYDSLRAAMAANNDAVKAATESLESQRNRASNVSHAADLPRAMPDPGATFESARDNLTDLFRAQPLALGVIGLAIGAGMAAAIPGTEIENSYLGETAKALKNKTAELAGQQVEKVTTLANDVMDATAEEARKQGLTIEGARAAAGDVVGKLSRIADAAQQTVSKRANDH
jgi:hypothetical protein